MAYYDEIVMLKLGLGRWSPSGSHPHPTRVGNPAKRRISGKLRFWATRCLPPARRGRTTSA